MLLIVTGVGFLIHIYSVGYMEHEGGYYRYFAYLNIFMFFMLTLILANNYLLMFVGWEGVGLASYLLIGFWFLKDSAANAGKKAFITNRVGDFGFLIALFLLIKHFGTLQYETVFKALSAYPVEASAGLLTAIGLLMMVGASGKSAQIPLYVWLPDAMEGPTPVSALIHAATMVTAGVYMVARSNAVFNRAPIALMVVAVIGTLTAIFAASIGIVQTDIKKVLAYSTISQLGYMFMGCGVAAYGAGIFHLMTHAFFKALLFLSAGAIIHGLGGEQDMRHMGGLRKYMPKTFWCMTIATFTIAGFPPLAAFFSKDEILWATWASGNHVLWLIGLIAAGMTSFYMFRLWFMTFFGEYRGAPTDRRAPRARQPRRAWRSRHSAREPDGHDHPAHDSGGALVRWRMGRRSRGTRRLRPFRSFPRSCLSPTLRRAPARKLPRYPPVTKTSAAPKSPSCGSPSVLPPWLPRRMVPVLQAHRSSCKDGREPLAGSTPSYSTSTRWTNSMERPIIRPIVLASTNILWKGIDATLIDGAVDESAAGAQDISDGVRHMQSGNIRSYAGWVAFGAAVVIAFMVWKGVR